MPGRLISPPRRGAPALYSGHPALRTKMFSAASTFAATAEAACLTGANAWVTSPVLAQTGRFEMRFIAVPLTAGLDGLIGLSGSAGSAFTDFAAMIRFSTANTIDARSGSVYKADAAVPYSAGQPYAFRVVVDVPARTYCVYVTPPAKPEQLLANNYAFRTEQANTALLASYGVFSTFGSMQVCEVAISAVANKAPYPIVRATPTGGTAPLTVQFNGSYSTDSDGSIVSYVWTFGDGQTATGATVTHLYTKGGLYSPRLTVTDNQGASATAAVAMVIRFPVNQGPVAVAKADVTSGPAPLTVTFDASGSSDADGSIASYTWAFGDGSIGTGAKVTHIYGAPGVFTATLTVTDNAGAKSTNNVPISISAADNCTDSSIAWQGGAIDNFTDLVEAQFDVIPQAAATDGLIGLSQGTGVMWSSFATLIRFSTANRIDVRNGAVYAADSAISYVPGKSYHFRVIADVPAHRYDVFVQPEGAAEQALATGYAFRTEQQGVTALNHWAHCAGLGAQRVCNFTAAAKTRNRPPIAAATPTPISGDAPLLVRYDASSSSDADGSIVSYEWTFGDNTAAVSTSGTSHTYTQAGDYTATLKVTDNAGAVGTKTTTIQVRSPAGACQTSSATFQNHAMTAQSGAFTVDFDVTPSGANMDGGVGLAALTVANYADLATAVRFNTAGQIDVLGGNSYAADATLSYVAGKSYHVRMNVGVLARAYTVYVTPAGGTTQLLAANYPFRTEQASVTSLGNRAIWSTTGSLQVCNFTVGGAPSPLLAASTNTLDFGSASSNLSFDLWNAGGSTLSYTIADNASWMSVSTVSGQSAGERDTITATVNRSGLAAGTYLGTITVTPSTGAALTLAVTMSYAAVPQIKLKPIARWDVVPYQRINPGSTLNCGVVAFSKFGIARVRFTITGQGYRGTSPVDVTSMTYNEQSGVWEYWTPIKAADFASNGPISVEAAVYGLDGGLRDKTTDGGGVGLDTLNLVVNPTGSLTQVEAWVSTSGSDSSGTVGDSTRPFATLGKAIDAIRANRSSRGLGNNADGGIVRLMPGNHTCSNGGVAGPILCDTEWLTITTAAGGTRSNTVLLPGGIVPTRKIAVRGITLNGAGTLGMGGSDRTQAHVWADNCSIIGSGRGNSWAHPLSSEYARLYYTGSSITEVAQATSGSQLCRGLTITRISDDAFQNVPLVINCAVDDIDPLSTGAHADCWQHGAGNDTNKVDHNVIVYNLKATNLKYQSLFIRGDIYSPPTKSSGMAFVNVYMAMRSDGYGWGGWYRWVDHLLWWNCSFPVKGMGIMGDTYANVKQPCSISNFSVRGCTFAFLGAGNDTAVDYSEWDTNHFVDPSFTKGRNITTGNDMLDANGVPMSGSPLLNRMSAVVPIDAANKIRTGLADVGAFER